MTTDALFWSRWRSGRPGYFLGAAVGVSRWQPVGTELSASLFRRCSLGRPSLICFPAPLEIRGRNYPDFMEVARPTRDPFKIRIRALEEGLSPFAVRSYETRGRELPVEARHLATAQIALDIGLAVQHLVDPEAVPLDIYPKLFEVLFGQLLTPPSGTE